ncbi:hypothetical protein NCAS_0D00230 [Naumovozyma castellii]|uniref:protein-tyrosine-phosphatase n=1 Tax=Naumovozyma castellii TaxID=27288 RepID=G0VEY5_NAUCA|nr:hypothetical protein NCAS_0D00230 [Naumovozyma castellii CBS 4309]CCC69604.1 hypothetical protein NCAS_0D00230 [Naumovozyma castellii CBS 4309]
MVSSKHIPWYLQQSDLELSKKFKFIQNQEDERLREATNGTANSRWSLGSSILAKNDIRNRYVNIMPYERNRVQLDVVSGNDYINASYVKVDIHDQSINPGYYIATQGPTKHTWEQFWQMCYKECPHEHIVIVMVTPLEEFGKEKCFPYWPRNSSDPLKISRKVQNLDGKGNTSEFASSLEIKYENGEKYGNDYTLTTMKLKPTDPAVGPEKTVYHFYFDQWRDMRKPEEIVPIMQLCNHSHILNSSGNPIIVHCSAGVGRSGTFIALDHLTHETIDFRDIKDNTIPAPDDDYKKDLVEQIVLQLRAQRMKMVQIKDQFTFIYHAARRLQELTGSN